MRALVSTLTISAVAVAVACGGRDAKGPSSPRAASPYDPATATAPSVAPRDHGRGVSLTEDAPYDQRYDPSGWSGRSTPPSAIGGGPHAPSATAPDSASSPTGAAPHTAPKTTPDAPKALPPTNLGKELQF